MKLSLVRLEPVRAIFAPYSRRTKEMLMKGHVATEKEASRAN